MRVIYTKKSYESEGRYKPFWSKEGYMCSQIHSQYVRLDYDWSTKKCPNQQFSQHLINVWDFERIKLIWNLKKILSFLKFPKNS